MVHRIKNRIRSFTKNTLPVYFYRSGFLSSLYYLLFDRSFVREHKAVLAGKVKHIRESKNSEGNYFLLVRNTHRIEKGLLMRPKRDVFGKEYIKETIDSFEAIWDAREIDNNSQMKWFFDVLSEYFLSAKKDEMIAKEFTRFSKIISTEISENCEQKSIPYCRLVAEQSSISFDEFYKLTRHRRSVRWFLDRAVPRQLIDQAILAANQSPSACNRQPFEFRVFDDPVLVKQAIDLPMGTRGYGHTVPVFIVVVGNLDAYFDERDRHVIYIDASLASMTFMLALETLGLSSCAINWPDIESREVAMEGFLSLKSHQRALMCLGVGYPDPEGMVAFSAKRPIGKIRRYN